MATAEAGLELPIGLTEQRFMQQLARIEAKAIKSARTSQQAFVAANDNIGRSFGNMSRQATAQLQNVSFQLQDILVQVAGGQGLGRALGQQLPQLLGGFGALGAVLGVVAGAGIGLASMFMSSGEEADKLGDKITELNGSLKSYYDAVEAANAPTSELVEKYGVAAGAAQRLLEQLAQLAKLDAVSTLRSTAQDIATQFESLAGLLDQIDAEEALGLGDSGLVAGAIDQINQQFGLTVDQARELQAILTDQQMASTPAEVADTMARMAEFMARVGEEANYANDNLVSASKTVTEGALAGLEFAEAMNGAAVAAGGVLAATDQLPGSINAAAASAVDLARALAAAIGAAQSLPGARFGAPSLGRFGNGEDITRRAGGADMQEQQTFRANWLAQLDNIGSGGRGGGRRRSGGGRKSGGGGGSGRSERPFFENIEKDLADLERQLTLIGKTTAEVATLEARWEMLDEAKRRGTPVNEMLNAQIDAQAAKVGQLTAELERAEIAQQQFDDAVDGIADAFAGAIVAGEDLREGLAQVFKQIASDILTSGIRNALGSVFNPQGGGSSLLGNIFGGLFGGRAPSFDGGGFTGIGGRSGGIDGKGGFPAILHPNETVVDHTKGQRAGGAQSLHVTAEVRENGGLAIFVQDQAGQVVAQSAPQIVGRSVGATRKSMGKSKAGWGI